MADTLLRLAPVAPLDERAARRTLREQVAHLEDELSGLFVSAWPRRGLELSVPASGGARVLSLTELEELRDDLARRAHDARRSLSEQTYVEEQHRCRIEEMLFDPEAHRWVRVSNEDIGEPGCKHWHVRSRWGILGMLMKWWRVRISSGCPLATSHLSSRRAPGRGRARLRCRLPARGAGLRAAPQSSRHSPSSLRSHRAWCPPAPAPCSA